MHSDGVLNCYITHTAEPLCLSIYSYKQAQCSIYPTYKYVCMYEQYVIMAGNRTPVSLHMKSVCVRVCGVCACVSIVLLHMQCM